MRRPLWECGALHGSCGAPHGDAAPSPRPIVHRGEGAPAPSSCERAEHRSGIRDPRRHPHLPFERADADAPEADRGQSAPPAPPIPPQTWGYGALAASALPAFLEMRPLIWGCGALAASDRPPGRGRPGSTGRARSARARSARARSAHPRAPFTSAPEENLPALRDRSVATPILPLKTAADAARASVKMLFRRNRHPPSGPVFPMRTTIPAIFARVSPRRKSRESLSNKKVRPPSAEKIDGVRGPTISSALGSGQPHPVVVSIV